MSLRRHSSRLNLSWYAKRLRVMGPAEVVHRIAEACGLKLLETQHRLGRPLVRHTVEDVARSSFCTSGTKQLPELPWSCQFDDTLVDSLLQRKLSVLGHEWTWKPEKSVWHEAPDTHRQWPQIFFGRIPYRQGNPYGDVRIAWEPSRLQHLVLLGLCAGRTNADLAQRAAALLEAEFLSWIDANPFLTGIHYISAMECGLRVLAVCYALDSARSHLRHAEQVWVGLLDLVYGHAEFISKRLSVHSSAGNHTVAEAAALVYAGSLLPEMRRAPQWLALGLSLLEHEGPRQVLRDGGGAEQSLWYLRFVSDLYGLVCALLHQHQQPIPAAVEEAFQRSSACLESFGSQCGLLPRFGDGDNGYALSPFLQFTKMERALPSGAHTFEISGCSIIRGRTELQHRLIFDHGSLGMAPCYAHGHADALSVVLTLGGEDVLLDTGTYTYTGEKKWREYFRGTGAHNTVVVDGLDQAVQETVFMWSQPYEARLLLRQEDTNGAVTLLASHDGYKKRLGVSHLRAILYEPPNRWLIWDRLLGEGAHQLELHWHLGIDPYMSAESYVLPGAAASVYLTVQGGDTKLRKGEIDPIIGWRSVQYGSKERISTLQTTYAGRLPHEFLTWVRIGDQAEQADSTFRRLSDVRRIIDQTEAR